MSRKIYLDNNATTPLAPQVLQAMVAELNALPSNPSSIHEWGRRGKQQLSEARARLASFFRVRPEEVFFTSGGTESVQWMIASLPKGHLITTAIEHSSVYETVRFLEQRGYSVTYLKVGLRGTPTVEQVAEALRPDTKGIILSASNGETGVRLPLDPIAQLAAQEGIPLLIDGIAFTGKEEVFFPPGVTGWAIAGHKFHGPPGVGALIVRSSFPLPPLFRGGPQEKGKRAGTENLPAIVGLGVAIELLSKEQSQFTAHLLSLRSHFEGQILRALPNVLINGEGERISNTSNLAFLGCDGETLLLQLDQLGVAASHGSACSAGALEPSRVLLEMGIDRKRARSSIRFSFSRMNTKDEVDEALERLIGLVKKLQS